MPSTFAHALFPSACALIARGSFPRLDRRQCVRLALVAAFLGNSPDLDLIPASLLVDRWMTIHREWGHNIFSLTLLVWLGTWLLRRFVSPLMGRRQAWIVSATLVASHILLDSMGDYASNGQRPAIPIFFPVSTWSFHLPFRLFSCVTLPEGYHPVLAHALAADFWTQVIFREIFFVGVLTALWGAAYASARWASRRSKAVQTPESSTAQPLDIERRAA